MGRGSAKGGAKAREATAAQLNLAKDTSEAVAAATTEQKPKEMENSAQPEMRSQNSVMNVPTPFRRRNPRSERTRTQGDDDASRSEVTPIVLEDIMRRQGLDAAWDALEAMQQAGTRTDKFGVSRLLMKTVSEGGARWHSARVYRSIAIVEKFITQQPEDVDEVLFNALLDTCGRIKDLPRLESIAARMRDLKVKPSPVTLGILVKTYGQAGDIQKVLNSWDEMETQRAEANAVTYGCMLDACVKCGQLAKAVEIFNEMRATGKHKNTVLFTTLIKGYGLERNLARALELFREMPQIEVPYNTITWNSIIEVAVKCNDLQTAECLLREMATPGSACEPDLITFSTVLKGYCNVGDIDKALHVVEAIKAKGLRCDELVYNTLMDGCVKMDDIATGVGLFAEMVDSGIKPSQVTHSVLNRLYARAGLEEDVAYAVAELYVHHGLEPPALGDRSGRFAARKWQQPQSPGSRSMRKRSGATPKGSHLSWRDGWDGEEWDNNWSGEIQCGQGYGTNRQLNFSDQCYGGEWDHSEPCTPFSLSTCQTPYDSGGYGSNPFGLSPSSAYNSSGGQIHTNGTGTPLGRAMTMPEAMAMGGNGYNVIAYGSPFGNSPLQPPNFDNSGCGGMMPFTSPASMQQVVMSSPQQTSPSPLGVPPQQQQSVPLPMQPMIQPMPEHFQTMPQQQIRQAMPLSLQQLTSTMPNERIVQARQTPQGMPSQPIAQETGAAPPRPSLDQSPCIW
jgi:pentatricopeptide repeat protein